VETTRALLSSPPLALASFALASAALLVERLLAAVARGVDPEAVLPPLLFWIAVSTAFGAFWLLNALRLAGLAASPPNRLTTAGAFATAVAGAILARIDPAGLAADALVIGLSSSCFATFFLLHVVLRRERVGAVSGH
jgi:hypothetical protein